MSPSAEPAEPTVGGLDELRGPTEQPESLDQLTERVKGSPLLPVRPQWTNEAIPPEQRVTTFLGDHMKELRPWEDVEQNFRAYFPGSNPKPLKDVYEKGARLEGWRQAAKQQLSEQQWDYFLNRNFAPFASPIIRLGDSIAYGHARERFVAGKATDEDMQGMAFHERMKEIEAARTPGQQAGMAVGHVVPLILESMIGGGALKALGIGAGGVEALGADAAIDWSARGLASAAPGAIGRAAAQTVVMPSMYLAQAGERSEAQGGEWYHPENLGPAYGLGFAQVAVLHGLGKIPTGISGSGALPYIARAGVRAGIGTAGQTGIIDPGASLLSEVLPKAYKLETGYGALGDIARGNTEKGLQRIGITALTFAAFSAFQGGQDVNHNRVPEAVQKSLQEAADLGMTPENAGTPILNIERQLTEALKRNPDLTREEARAMFKDVSKSGNFPDLMRPSAGAEPIRPGSSAEPIKPGGVQVPSYYDVAMAMADSLPSKAPKTPSKPPTDLPPEPPNAQPQGPPPPQPGPQAGTQPAAPPTPPQPAPSPTLPPAPPEATAPRTAGDRLGRVAAPTGQQQVASLFKGQFPDAVRTPKPESPGQMETTVAGRKVYGAYDSGEKALKIDFDPKPNETSGVKQGGMREGTLDLTRALLGLVGKAKQAGLKVVYTTEPGRAESYAKAMERSGYELESTKDGNKPSQSTYTWKPAEPAPPQGGTPAPEPGTGLINPVQSGVPGVVSGAKEIAPEPPAPPAKPVPEPLKQTAQQIADAFAGMGKGVHEAANAKQEEYATRIMNGEKDEDVLQGLDPNKATYKAVMARVEAMRAAQPPAPVAPTPEPKVDTDAEYAVRTARDKTRQMGIPPERVDQAIADSGAESFDAFKKSLGKKNAAGKTSALKDSRPAMAYAKAVFDAREQTSEPETRPVNPKTEANLAKLQAKLGKNTVITPADIDELLDDAGLTPTEKNVLLGRSQEGMTMEEAAEHNGLNSKQRADQHFAKALEKIGVTRDGWNAMQKEAEGEGFVSRKMTREESAGATGRTQRAEGDRPSKELWRADEVPLLENRLEQINDEVQNILKKRPLTPKEEAKYVAEVTKLNQLDEAADEAKVSRPRTAAQRKQSASVRRDQSGDVPARDAAPEAPAQGEAVVRSPEDTGQPRSATPATERGSPGGNELTPVSLAGERAHYSEYEIPQLREHLDSLNEMTSPARKQTRNELLGLLDNFQEGKALESTVERLGTKAQRPADVAAVRQFLDKAEPLIEKYHQDMHDMVHGEAKNEIAEVQAADKATGLSHAATEEGIASANAEAQRLASEEHARGSAATGSPADQPAVPTPGQPGATGGIGGRVAGHVGEFLKGEEGFVDLDKIHELIGKVKDWFSETKPGKMADAAQSLLAPSARGEQAGKAGGILREGLAILAHKKAVALNALKSAKSYYDSVIFATKDPAVRQAAFLQFTDAVESGDHTALPAEIRPFADTLRKLIDERTQQLGDRDLVKSFIENYFGHLWESPDRSPEDIGKEFAARTGGSLTGAESFRKARSIPTYREGVEKGLTPRSWNPIELGLANLAEMDKSVFGHDAFEEMKEQGLAEFVPLSGRSPMGWTKFTDKLSTVFRPGPTLTGSYYVPEPVAQLLNNYVEPGLRGNPIFDAARGLGNAMNQASLSLSAFHATAEFMNAQMSGVSLGLQYISRGEFLKGAAQLIGSPFAPFKNILDSSSFLKEYYNPGSQGAEMGEVVRNFEKSGARAEMDKFYGGDQLQAFVKAFRQVKGGELGQIPAMIGRGLQAIPEVLSKPIMEVLVPRLKIGAQMQLMRYEAERMPPGTDINEQRARFGKAWDSVENRMGQLTYDNLFWNKTFKDMSMLMVRSVGWNLGTIRELGGAAKDIPSSIKGVFKGEGISPRLGYAIALPLVTAAYGAMYQYLMTGKGPDETKDYFFPKTGSLRKDGTPDRIAFPTYMKDVATIGNRGSEGPYRIAQNIGSAAKSKTHPAVTNFVEMVNNEDFYGQAILDPRDSIMQQTWDLAKHMAGGFEPLSAAALLKQKDVTAGQAAQRSLGLMPARSDIAHTYEQQRAIEDARKRVLSPLAKKRLGMVQ